MLCILRLSLNCVVRFGPCGTPPQPRSPPSRSHGRLAGCGDDPFSMWGSFLLQEGMLPTCIEGMVIKPLPVTAAARPRSEQSAETRSARDGLHRAILPRIPRIRGVSGRRSLLRVAHGGATGQTRYDAPTTPTSPAGFPANPRLKHTRPFQQQPSTWD